MKHCRKCNTDKPKSEFGTNKAKKDGLQANCKECRRTYAAEWYKENQKLHLTRVLVSNRKKAAEQRVALKAFLEDKKCVDCGETDSVVLEFDHVRGKKKHNIARMIGKFSWKTILIEIQKCDVRCANCHRRKTAKQLNWFKGI